MKNKENIKNVAIGSLILFAILYGLRIILTILHAGYIVEIYYGIGILIGVCMERWRCRKVFLALDTLSDLMENKINDQPRQDLQKKNPKIPL